MMNTAAGLVGRSPLPVAPPAASDQATPEAAGNGDFSAVLAAASPDTEETDLPDGTQSAAALALLAGLLGACATAEPAPPETDTMDGTGDAATGGAIQADGSAVPGKAAGIAAGMASPIDLLRGLGANALRDAVTAAQGESAAVAAAAGINADAAPPAEGSADSSAMGDRLIGALLERASAHAGAADGETRGATGPNLYVNAREAVASAAGQVSSLPEAVRSAVGSPRWANELGSRLVMMSVRGQQEGSLSLTPEHLGPLEVRISVAQDSTSIWFGAQHADTRAALTDALPRLREMFAASGLALGHAGVSHDMPRQDTRRHESAVAAAAAAGPAEAAAVAPVARGLRAALLDAWA